MNGMMKEMRRNMRRVFWLLFGLFFLTGGYLWKTAFVDASAIAPSPYNRRINMSPAGVRRGGIYAANQEPIAISQPDGSGGYERVYPFGNIFSHVAGYSGAGKSGIELAYTFEMEKLRFELAQRVNHAITGKEMTGNSVITSLDPALQKMAVTKLKKQENHRGAIVMIEPSTGRVLAMASSPGFDPENIGADWSSLSGDTENSPLLNRGGQGLYPPGSTFKVITAAAALKADPELAHFTWECKGEADFGGKIIHCYGNKAHGEVDLKKALAVSCNTYFGRLGEFIGADAIQEAAEGFGFNGDLHFPLAYRTSSFAMDENGGASQLVETSIGQGKTLATPLHMAMVAAAIGNGGIMMKPMVVDGVCDGSMNDIRKYTPQVLKRCVSPEIAGMINTMLVEAVKTGTGKNAAIGGIEVAGKTGTAQNASGDDHSWFIAYAPADNPKVAIAVILENGGAGSKAAAVAHDLLELGLEMD